MDLETRPPVKFPHTDESIRALVTRRPSREELKSTSCVGRDRKHSGEREPNLRRFQSENLLCVYRRRIVLRNPKRLAERLGR